MVPIIKTVDLTKKFGDFTANDAINFKVEEGEIKAVVGENGAGKTTLMNMIYGLLQPTSGSMFIRGQQVDFKTPTDAINMGIGMVHQHFKLVPSLTVYENVLLGIEMKKTVSLGEKTFKMPYLDKRRAKKEVQVIIDEYGFNLDASSRVKDLSIGAKQKVEILKMLYREVDIVIFDEPTAVLTPQEIESFFKTMRRMKEHGKTLILITHKLREVMEVSDSVVVIKDGQVVGDMPTEKTNEVELARLMVGRDVLLKVDKEYKSLRQKPEVYEVRNLSTENDEGVEVVKNVSFTIRKGEILGVAGVEGNGQSELLKLLTGLMRATNGNVTLHGKDITNAWPGQLRKKGVAMIPEDRYIHGLCQEMTIGDNTIAGYHDRRDVCSRGLMKRKAIEQRRDALIDKYDIRISEKGGFVSSLSGGNAQKIIIAREFDADPDVLIAAQPTRGVDIGAIEFIHNSLLELADAGKSVLLISNELSEVMSLADRIVVMYKGEIIGEVDAKQADREQIGMLMAGVKEGGEERETKQA